MGQFTVACWHCCYGDKTINFKSAVDAKGLIILAMPVYYFKQHKMAYKQADKDPIMQIESLATENTRITRVNWLCHIICKLSFVG